MPTEAFSFQMSSSLFLIKIGSPSKKTFMKQEKSLKMDLKKKKVLNSLKLPYLKLLHN